MRTIQLLAQVAGGAAMLGAMVMIGGTQLTAYLLTATTVAGIALAVYIARGLAYLADEFDRASKRDWRSHGVKAVQRHRNGTITLIY